eukprot:scaffold197283_cov51-Attheya_sp.AAC.2
MRVNRANNNTSSRFLFLRSSSSLQVEGLQDFYGGSPYNDFNMDCFAFPFRAVPYKKYVVTYYASRNHHQWAVVRVDDDWHSPALSSPSASLY